MSTVERLEPSEAPYPLKAAHIHLEEPELTVCMRNCSCPGPLCSYGGTTASVPMAEGLKSLVLAFWVCLEGLELPHSFQVQAGDLQFLFLPSVSM